MKFWEFKAAATNNEPHELLIYGEIGEWAEVSSADFNRELKSVTSKLIHVKINSGGGSVFTAQAILSSLKRHSADIEVYIDGLAASAASIIAMAGKVIMPSNAMMMIHNPGTFAGGESKDFRKAADMLDKIRETLVGAYAAKTGLDNERIIAIMDAETWLTAEEAVELGFADEIEQDLKIAACLKDGQLIVNNLSFDASKFNMIPAAWANMPENKSQKPKQTESSQSAGSHKPEIKKENEPMNLEKLKADHPELYAAVIELGKEEGKTDGTKAERARIESIEAMAMPGHDDIVADAKFKTGITAEALAVEIVKAEKASKGQFLANRQADADKLNGIGDAGTETAATDSAKVAADQADLARFTAAATKGFNANRR